MSKEVIGVEERIRIALIPAYEPKEVLSGILRELEDAGFRTVLVDDGSGEAYHALFDAASARSVVLTHPENYGKGRALKTGLAYIAEYFGKHYTVVTLDADGQHRIADAVRISETAGRHPDELILGCRDFKENTPLRSRFGNLVTRGVYRLSTGRRVTDTQTGLRAFSDLLADRLLAVSGERYEYEMNVLLTFTKEHVPIREVPIATLYFDNNAGSHFRTVKDSYRIYKEIVKFSASSFVSFLIDYSVYFLMVLATGGLPRAVSLPLSNVTARLISGSVNFTINRKVVFPGSRNVWRSALRYVLLATCILLGNTTLLSVLTVRLRVNPYLAKLITELLFFIISWTVQRFYVFRSKNGISKEKENMASGRDATVKRRDGVLKRKDSRL